MPAGHLTRGSGISYDSSLPLSDASKCQNCDCMTIGSMGDILQEVYSAAGLSRICAAPPDGFSLGDCHVLGLCSEVHDGFFASLVCLCCGICSMRLWMNSVA